MSKKKNQFEIGRSEYLITLPDNKTLRLWFIGPYLEMLLKAYNIPYKKVDNKC